MDLGNIMLSEIRQKDILYDITHIWNLKNNTNECICKNRLTDIKNKLVVTKGEREGGKKLWNYG